MKTLIKWIGGSCALVGVLGAAEVKSPDGKIVVDFELGADGVPGYTLTRAGAPVLGGSRLGLVLADADFSRGLKLVSESKNQRVRDRYELAASKQRERRRRSC